MKKLMVIDGNSIVNRAFYGVSQSLTTREGQPTNAIFGFLNILLKLLDEEQHGAYLDSYGRVGCTAGDLTQINREDYVRLRRGTFGNELLVPDRKSFAKKYPGLTVDRVSLEDIMLFVGKGEAQ